jgi:hypothetical protein
LHRRFGDSRLQNPLVSFVSFGTAIAKKSLTTQRKRLKFSRRAQYSDAVLSVAMFFEQNTGMDLGIATVQYCFSTDQK